VFGDLPVAESSDSIASSIMSLQLMTDPDQSKVERIAKQAAVWCASTALVAITCSDILLSAFMQLAHGGPLLRR